MNWMLNAVFGLSLLKSDSCVRLCMCVRSFLCVCVCVCVLTCVCVCVHVCVVVNVYVCMCRCVCVCVSVGTCLWLVLVLALVVGTLGVLRVCVCVCVCLSVCVCVCVCVCVRVCAYVLRVWLYSCLSVSAPVLLYVTSPLHVSVFDVCVRHCFCQCRCLCPVLWLFFFPLVYHISYPYAQGAHAAAVGSIVLRYCRLSMFRWSDFWGRNFIWQGTIVKSLILLYLLLVFLGSCFATAEKHHNRYVSVKIHLFYRLKSLKSIEFVSFQFNLLYFFDSNRVFEVFARISFIFITKIKNCLKKIRPGSSMTFFHLLIFIGV